MPTMTTSRAIAHGRRMRIRCPDLVLFFGLGGRAQRPCDKPRGRGGHACCRIIEAIDVRPDDWLLLFMPMSNFQQRTLYYTSLWCDCDIVITDYLHLPAAIKQTQPTILIAPPMYFQMIYTRFVNFPEAKKGCGIFWGWRSSWLPASVRRAPGGAPVRANFIGSSAAGCGF